MTRADVVEALEEAKAGRLERLYLLISVSVRSTNPDKDEIVTESLLTIANKLRKGEPVTVLADQLGGIVKNHRLRAYKKETKAKDALSIGGAEQLERLASEFDDPAAVLERAEQVDAEIAMYARMKEEKPRAFALLMADFHEIPPVEFFEKLRGETLTPANAWKLRERAKKTAKKGLQEIRKDSSS